MFLRRSARVLCLGLLAAGCEDLRDFKTGVHDVYRGEVVGSDANATAESFIRKGFASHTQLELRFDPGASGVSLDAGEPTGTRVAGTVHTFACADGHPDCDQAERIVGPFDHARLISIESLAHDTLSQYTFPGGGRLRNFIFSVRFATELDAERLHRDATIFLSLMDSGEVELRAMAPSVLSDEGDSERLPALFGVFVLQHKHR